MLIENYDKWCAEIEQYHKEYSIIEDKDFILSLNSKGFMAGPVVMYEGKAIAAKSRLAYSREEITKQLSSTPHILFMIFNTSLGHKHNKYMVRYAEIETK